MMDLDDASLNGAIEAAVKDSVELLKEVWGRAPKPRKDGKGVLRLGYGRAIELRDQSMVAAELELKEDVMSAAEILKFELFSLLAIHPERQGALSHIIAVADLIGPERIRDNHDLWHAMKIGDWEEAAAIINDFRWIDFVEASGKDRRAVSRLLVRIIKGVVDVDETAG